MANYEESNPFLPKQEKEAGIKHETKSSTSTGTSTAKNGGPPPPPPPAVPVGWTANGLPVGEPVMHREPLTQRSQWHSRVFSCLGRNDEFYSSDLEVCLLGAVAPCVLHGSNVERLGYAPGIFANQCLPYTGLYVIGSCFFGWNCLAPWFSYPTRTAIRRNFNLEGNCEELVRSFGCCGGCGMDEVQNEHCETACDLATHVFCHPCALCQEARELRRRLPHPGFMGKAVMVMIPPGGQTMGRVA
ncbi:cell number regulator 8 [Sesamum indicum]|uniref:Cell number regulator 8 n=1 Tax=Sesamum indicum TaxID=4182 RepID=A0A6I9T9U0_SESIN|nr:cell number regulator 8 [Sesamum indicum]